MSRIAEQMQQLLAAGIDTFKLNGCEEMRMLDSPRAVSAAVAKVERVRAMLGDAVDFGLDFHGRVAAPMARPLLRALELH